MRRFLHPAGASALGRPAVRAVIEGGAMLLALLAMDAVTGGTRFAGVNPHPFGLPVLLVAAQYGMGPGAVLALMAAAARYLGAWPEMGFGEDAAAHLRALATNPLLWLGLALVVGGLSDRLRARAVRAEEAARRGHAELVSMVETNTRLSGALSVLEGKVAGQLRTASSITEAARGLGPDVSGVLRGAPPLLRAATECARCSFYLLQGDVLRLAASEGWSAGGAPAAEIAYGPLFDAVVGQRAVLVANRTEDRAALNGQGVLAGPVISGADGAVLGILKIEEIGFARLHLDTVANFRAVCDWVGTALANAEALSAAERERFRVDSGRLVSVHQAERMVAFMTTLAERLGFDLSLFSVELTAGRIEDEAALRVLLERQFRQSDMLLQASAGGRRYSALLPGTGPVGARLLLDRVAREIHAELPGLAPALSLSCVMLHEGREAVVPSALPVEARRTRPVVVGEQRTEASRDAMPAPAATPAIAQPVIIRPYVAPTPEGPRRTLDRLLRSLQTDRQDVARNGTPASVAESHATRRAA
ncbi:GAF domain-containing protein [Muricoccus radiodurans]|uniref:GAF domain-containing protein n=1 Tax=Muricoccus radiodurans TaxID=2231721 RepID=UPI003CF8CB57